MTLDQQAIGLSIALTYPKCAFADEDPHVAEVARILVERARRGDPVGGEIKAMLARHPYLNEWIAQLLEDPGLLPPHLQQRKVREYEPLGIPRSPVMSPKYTCATEGCAGVWYMTSAGERIPCCRICDKDALRLDETWQTGAETSD